MLVLVVGGINVQMFAPNLAGVAAARGEINQRALAAGPGHGQGSLRNYSAASRESI